MSGSAGPRAARHNERLLPLLLLLAAGCAAGGAGGGTGGSAGYVHEYAATGDEGVRFELVSEAAISMEQPMPMDMGMIATAGLTVSVGAGTTTREVTLAVDEFATELTGALAEQAGLFSSEMFGDLLDLKGKVETLELDARGGIATGTDLLTMNVGPSMASLASYAQLMFIPWPEGPIVPGHAWTDTVRISADQEISLEMLTINHYEYLGLQDVEIDDRLVTLHAVSRDGETAMTGGAEVEGFSTDMVVTGTGRGTLYFSPDGGLVKQATNDDIMAMTMAIGAMEMTMDTTYRTVIRRLP